MADIKIYGKLINAIEGGKIVNYEDIENTPILEANPTGEGSETLEKIQIGEKVYNIPQGSGGSGSGDVTAAGDNTFTGNNTFTGSSTTFWNPVLSYSEAKVPTIKVAMPKRDAYYITFPGQEATLATTEDILTKSEQIYSDITDLNTKYAELNNAVILKADNSSLNNVITQQNNLSTKVEAQGTELKSYQQALQSKADWANLIFQPTSEGDNCEVTNGIGGLKTGVSIKGKSIMEVLYTILFGKASTIYPVITNPTLTASLSKEYQGVVGQDLTVQGTITYNPGKITLNGVYQNDTAGAATSCIIKRDASDQGTTVDLNNVTENPDHTKTYSFTYTFNNLVAGANTATIILNYGEGNLPLNSNGESVNANGENYTKLVAGSLNAELRVTAYAVSIKEPQVTVTANPASGTAGKELSSTITVTYIPQKVKIGNVEQEYYSTGDVTSCTVNGETATQDSIDKNKFTYIYQTSSLSQGATDLDVKVAYAQGSGQYHLGAGEITKTVTITGKNEIVENNNLYIGISTGSGETTFSPIEPVEIKDTDAEDITKQGPVTDSNNNVIGYQLNLPEAYSGTIEILLPKEYKQLKAWNPLSSDWEVASDYFIKGGSVEHEGNTYIKYSYEVDPDDPINEPFQYRFMLN